MAKLKDNLTKLEVKADSFLARLGGWLARLAASPHTVGIAAVLIVIALIAWAVLR